MAILEKVLRIHCLMPIGHAFLVKICGVTHITLPPQQSPLPHCCFYPLLPLEVNGESGALSVSARLEPRKYPLRVGGQRPHNASIACHHARQPSISTHTSRRGQACGLWEPPSEVETG